MLLRAFLAYSYTLNTVVHCVGKHWEFLPLQSLQKLAEDTHIQMLGKSDLRRLLGPFSGKRKWQRASEVSPEVWPSPSFLEQEKRTAGHITNWLPELLSVAPRCKESLLSFHTFLTLQFGVKL